MRTVTRLVIALAALAALPFMAGAQTSGSLASSVDAYYSSTAAALLGLQVLPVPPAPGTAAQAVNVQLLNTITSTATPQMIASAQWDATPDVFDFSAVLGSGFNAKSLPTANTFFTKVTINDEATNILLGQAYNSQGPISPASYPSAHTLLGFVDGVLLADMIPEKKDQLLTYGVQYGLNRLILGAHWPSDVTAAQMEATFLLPALSTSPKFMADYEQAKAEVRSALGYK